MPSQKYYDPKYGVINAIRDGDMPVEGILKAQNMYYRENEWQSVPGLTELNTAATGTDPVWAVYDFVLDTTKERITLCSSGGSLYKYSEANRTFTAIYNGLAPNKQVTFLQDRDKLYFGSDDNTWRRYDGGSVTYPIGSGSTAPSQFRKIVFNPYAQRYFAIKKNDPNMYWSEHIDNGGIEVWPASNSQIIESDQGDTPEDIAIFEGRITVICGNSISSGDVRGVPETWSFQREKSKTGTVAFQTVKRSGNQFLMLSANFEVYKWPDDVFITQGKIKFEIDKTLANLACAEVIEDRYYVLCFRHSLATSTNKYHYWVYDILGERWYGPSIQRNIVSMFWSKSRNLMLCGGADDLAGFVLENTGRNIKTTAIKRHIISSSSDFGEPSIVKRFHRGYIKARQMGYEKFYRAVGVAGASVTTSTVLRGNGSLLLNGTDGHVTVTDSNDFNFVGGIPWTIDLVARPALLTGSDRTLFALYTDGNSYLRGGLTSGGRVELVMVSGGSTVLSLQTAVSTVAIDTTYHIAFVFDGATYYIFVDGTLSNSVADSDVAEDYTAGLRIGRNASGSAYFNGRIDEFRISKGIARWTSAFTAPSAPNDIDPWTVLNLSFDQPSGATKFNDNSNSIDNRNLGGNVELLINVDNKEDTPHVQRIKLDDIENENLMDTGAVKKSVTKKFYIDDDKGLGHAVQWELKQEELNTDFNFSGIELEYALRHRKLNKVMA